MWVQGGCRGFGLTEGVGHVGGGRRDWVGEWGEGWGSGLREMGGYGWRERGRGVNVMRVEGRVSWFKEKGGLLGLGGGRGEGL